MGRSRWCRRTVSITPTHTPRSRWRSGVMHLDNGRLLMRQGLIQHVTISISIRHKHIRTAPIRALHRGSVRSRHHHRIGNLRRRQSAPDRHRTGIRRSRLLALRRVIIPIHVRRAVNLHSVFRRQIQTTGTAITVITPTGTMTVNTKTTSNRTRQSDAVRG